MASHPGETARPPVEQWCHCHIYLGNDDRLPVGRNGVSLSPLLFAWKKKQTNQQTNKKKNRIVQTAKEVGDGRSDGHYIWQATANCCDADCILAKFLEFIESLTQGPQLKSKRKVWVTKNVKVMNKCNGCIARRISWWIVFGSFLDLTVYKLAFYFILCWSNWPAKTFHYKISVTHVWYP